MATKVKQGFIDHSAEKSSCQFYLAEILPDGSNHATVTGSGDTDDYGAVKDAIAVVTLCNFTNAAIVTATDEEAGVTPTEDYAQRELGLWIQYTDTVNNQLGSFTIPGPSYLLLAQTNTDEVDIGANVTALALIAILEARLVSRFNNAIQVTRMRLVGRSN